MNYKEFKNKFNKVNSFDKYWNYFIAVSVILGGLFLLCTLIFSDWYDLKYIEKRGKISSKNLIYLLSIFLISIGLCGFWKIPLLYKIYKTKANSDFESNEQLVKDIAKSMNMILIENQQGYYYYRYKGKFWNLLDIYFFIENEYIYLNIQQTDYFYKGGFIDFGTSEKVKNKIVKKIILSIKK